MNRNQWKREANPERGVHSHDQATEDGHLLGGPVPSRVVLNVVLHRVTKSCIVFSNSSVYRYKLINK